MARFGRQAQVAYRRPVSPIQGDSLGGGLFQTRALLAEEYPFGRPPLGLPSAVLPAVLRSTGLAPAQSAREDRGWYAYDFGGSVPAISRAIGSSSPIAETPATDGSLKGSGTT